MNTKYLMACMILPFAITSCSSDATEEKPVTPPAVTKKEIKIGTNVSGLTKATDTGFDANDKCGLYVVNRGSGNASNTLQSTGNHVTTCASRTMAHGLPTPPSIGWTTPPMPISTFISPTRTVSAMSMPCHSA